MFKMKTQEIVELLQELDSTGSLSGVIDDRGKYLYLEETELEQITRFIDRRGRVTLDELITEWFVPYFFVQFFLVIHKKLTFLSFSNKIIKIEQHVTQQEVLSDDEE